MSLSILPPPLSLCASLYRGDCLCCLCLCRVVVAVGDFALQERIMDSLEEIFLEVQTKGNVSKEHMPNVEVSHLAPTRCHTSLIVSPPFVPSPSLMVQVC